MKKLWLLLGAAALIGALAWAFASADSGETIYYLNFKPEVADAYTKIAAEYEAETGVKLKVVTAASGTYEQTLTSEIAKADAPTIFQVNGPIGLREWQGYAADLSDSALYANLSDPTLALRADGQVLAVPYAVEGYGIIYNATLMDQYFALPDKAVPYASADEIIGFDALKAVVEDMTAHKEALGIRGVFASTSLAPGNQWRWQTHLLNLPMYFEFRELANGGDATLAGMEASEITFKYAENFRRIWELYLNNSVTDPKLLSGKTVDDAMAEFALGQCVMVQNGNWGASQILGLAGGTVEASELRFLPIYIGVGDEKAQGLCIGTENYLCINKNTSAEKQKASLDFLEWLFTSDKGKAFVKEELGFITPFNDAENPSDPLSAAVTEWMARDGVQSIPWIFAAFPSEAFKDYVGDALLEYAQGGLTWQEVVDVVIRRWKEER